MSPARNTPELWDRVWAGSIRVDAYLRDIAVEERSARWRRIEAALLAAHGELRGLKVVEIGAGLGTAGAMLARRGARVTIIDYSDSALEHSRRLFAALGLDAAFVRANALDLPAALRSAFDLSMSFGLAEHFCGADREGIVRAHFALLRAGGSAVISVPNSLNPPYRLFKFASERMGEWSVGEEYPFTPWELRRLAARCGAREYRVLGESLFSSLAFVRRTPGLRRFFARHPVRQAPVAPQRGTPLDRFLSYAVVLHARRKPE